MFLRISTLLAVTLLSACTWVKMTPQGGGVRVALAREDLSACQRRGEIAVAVEDSVAFYKRSRVKVRDELETLARNEAFSLNADTIQPKTEPLDGEQRFVAYACGRAVPASRPAARERSDSAETYPIDQ
ncbi:MAG TPA: DUF4156 domain-containing protein [Xanthomonadales bacterium]|nr:DUF4156 domain-containing protein [Xanthomonadales bacterium]